MLRDIHDSIYDRLKELIPDIEELEQGEGRKSEVKGLMPLTLDVLHRDSEGVRIALAHNFEMNGDLVPDPDMEIYVYLLDDWKKGEALTYQDQYTFQEVYPMPGKVAPAVKKSLNSFLQFWLKNCINQGHRLDKETQRQPIREEA